MPGKAAVAVALQPDTSVEPAAKQKSFPFVLKKIMDIPPPNILEECDDELEKEKLGSADDVEGGGVAAASAGGASRGGSGGSAGGVSASLTPAIWEKTIPYDGETFHLEYMDLDEFLLENGIPASLEDEELQKTLTPAGGKGKSTLKVAAAASATTTTASPSPPPVPDTSTGSPEPEEALTVTTLLPAKLEDDDDDDEDEDQEDEALLPEAKVAEVKESNPGTGERNTPSPINPDDIEVDVNFQPDPTDLVLSSVPGGELFNPRKHKFSDEELKPQPMIKKAKKVFVPNEQKDDKYWSRRKKNNLAAKRSRDARRLKENQITVRASFLERENAALRQQVAELRKDCGRCKATLARYEAKYGPL
ncbi:TEF transcription factor, PAR bZIP family member b isoform X2 [Corythoichthys intestinalis]|uniref:TEF transcription factor, PAR bZIP family member b isoform X2 n=1 Tax=Corythoichthys intestinalis TaxID=161448 RepID=UPI0025A528E7|nr:TEF transcription factor, PAR bZIP family member b isoform X2 [Corythoichthys intestinalis]XP_061805215.1 thyrotroph embryonic factor-like [Nerophis lumbriciformis]